MALTPKQERYAEAVASGMSKKEAAEKVGISVSMAGKWLKATPELQALISKLSVKVRKDAVSILAANLTTAASTMVDLLGVEQPPAIRLSAARGIFADYAAIKQFTELEAEFEKLAAAKAKTKVSP